MKLSLEAHALLVAIFAEHKANEALLERLMRGQITSAERTVVVDWIGLELFERGFNADGEPTEYGLQLERLLDDVNRPNLT